MPWVDSQCGVRVLHATRCPCLGILSWSFKLNQLSRLIKNSPRSRCSVRSQALVPRPISSSRRADRGARHGYWSEASSGYIGYIRTQTSHSSSSLARRVCVQRSLLHRPFFRRVHPHARPEVCKRPWLLLWSRRERRDKRHWRPQDLPCACV